MNDTIQSLIRTYSPMVIGPVLLWLSTKLGTDLSGLETHVVVIISQVVGAAYYAVARLLESRFPWAGVLLGSKAQPVYVKPTV